MTRKMSVHAGLGELKKIKQRLNSNISYGTYIGSKKKAANKVLDTDYTVEEFNTKVKAEMQSIEDELRNFTNIKNAIVISNAITKVTVGNNEMTVAETIEMKKLIEYKETLLSVLKRKRNNVFSNVASKNERVEENLDNQLASLGIKDKNSKASDDLAPFMEQYRLQNSYEVIDPLKIDELIAKLETEILDFKTNVDVALSESNALTMIEIPD